MVHEGGHARPCRCNVQAASGTRRRSSIPYGKCGRHMSLTNGEPKRATRSPGALGPWSSSSGPSRVMLLPDGLTLATHKLNLLHRASTNQGAHHHHCDV